MTELLRLTDLKKSYDGKKLALDGINLSVQSGEFIVVIGPSGAGKSTLIRTINQLVRPTSGTVYFDGCELTSLKGRALRKKRGDIGMIFQHYNLIGRTNVIKNVLHGRLSRMPFYKSLLGLYPEIERSQALKLLKTVGLEDQIYQRASDLSGGQMQRVGICRALMQEPKLILADEPIASLDPKSADIVMDQLKTITTRRQITCIVNLHQVDYAKQYATRILGVKEGKIVFDGPPEALSTKITAAIYAGKEEQMSLTGTENKDNKAAIKEITPTAPNEAPIPNATELHAPLVNSTAVVASETALSTATKETGGLAL